MIIMPGICRFYGIIIAMYYNEHNPPHLLLNKKSMESIIDVRPLENYNI